MIFPVTSIGYEAFYDMDDLKKITFEDSKTPLDMTGGFVFYGYDGYSKELQEVYLGRTLNLKSGNENYEFADRNNITTVTIGPGCEEIPNKLFQNCHKVSVVDFSKATSLKRIGQHAFEDCDEVTAITIPQNVKWIGYEAFYDMDKLVSIVIEDSPETLDMWEGAQFRAYDNKSGVLKSVYMGRNLMVDPDGYQKDNFYNRQITSVAFSRYVTDIPKNLFHNNPFASITFELGAGPLSIGEGALVGDGNTPISSITIPTAVSYIGKDAFYDNTSLVSLNLNMAKDALIEEDAFDNCTILQNIIVNIDGTMSSSQGSDCFEDVTYGMATLKFNPSDAEAIASQQPWKNFTKKDASYNGVMPFDYNGLTHNLKQGDDGVFRFENSLGELQTIHLKDEVPINAIVDFEAIVDYDRTITKTDDVWAETLYLPFSMEKPAGMKLYTMSPVQVSAYGSVRVTLEEADSIEAFKPYIVVPTEGTYRFPAVKRTIKAGHQDCVIQAVNDRFSFTFTGTIDGKAENQKQLIPTAENMKFTMVEQPVHPYRAMLQTTRDYTDFEGVELLNIDIKKDATDNIQTLKPAHEMLAHVTLSGTTFRKDGNWHSLYLPFDIENLKGTPLEGAEIRKVAKNPAYKDGILSIYYEKHNEKIYNGWPFIYRFEKGEDIDDPVFKYVQLYIGTWDTPRIYDFANIYGSYDAVSFKAGDSKTLFLDEDGVFRNPAKDITLGACNTYFVLQNDIDVSYAESIVFNEGDITRFDLDIATATGIDKLVKEDAAADEWYDLGGRRLGAQPATKGIYVRNGKKIAIK